MPDLVDQTFGKYRIISRLGAGGMSTVYRANDVTLDRDVAIKILSPHFARDPEFIERFRREARTIAALQHPYVLAVYELGEQEGQLYIAMQLLSGGTLADRLRKGPPSLQETTDILTRVAEALDYAHNAGVLHRDVKPSNIGFDSQGRPYLMDFGLAHLAQAATSLTQSGVMMGTPNYMAPEQGSGMGISPATDIYALGVIAFEMLTGRLPFEGDTPMAIIMGHVQRTPPLPSQLRPGIPKKIDDVIQKVLAKPPENRFESATAFSNALRSAVSQTVLQYPPQKPMPAPSKRETPAATAPWQVAPTESISPVPSEPLWRRLKDKLRTLIRRRQPDLPTEVFRPRPSSPPPEWPEPAGKILGMETVLARPTIAQSIIARGSPSLILHPEVIDLLAPVSKSMLNELLSHQEPERIVDYIVNFGSGRFIIAGYGSFGGTSLTNEICRSVRSKLSAEVVRRSATLLVTRFTYIESARDKPATWEVSVQGFTGEPVSLGKFAASPEASDKEYPALLTLFDTLEDVCNGHRLKSELRARIATILPSQSAVTHLILVIDKVLQADMLDEFLSQSLIHHAGVTCLVVTESEHYNRWPEKTIHTLKSRWKFEEWSVPCLWESESRFVKRTLERLVSSFLMESREAKDKYEAFRGHLAYVGRGQVGTTLYELRQLRYWQIDKDAGQAFIALDALDDDLIAQHAWVQDLLESNWSRILGSNFVGRQQTDRAKLGIYTLMDWIIDAATFTLEEILEEAERRPIIIAERKRKRDLAVQRLLNVLEDNRYLGRVQDSFDVIWGRDITEQEAIEAVRAKAVSRAKFRQKRLDELQVDYAAVSGQLSKTLSDLDRTRLERQLEALDAEIAKIEDELKGL